MSISLFIRKTINFICSCIPYGTKVYPRVVTLAPNELLKGRTALITGGTSGIGFEMAKAFINAGATVVITGRKLEKVQIACRSIEQEATNKGCIFGIELDNTKVNEFKSKFADVLSMLGGKQVDILVNNAGVLGCHISDGQESEYDAVLDTNLKGVFFLSQMIGHYMKDNKIEGNILNIASSSSLRPAASAYTLSKWGIRGLILGLAKTFAPLGITVNGLAPGQTATQMIVGKEHDGNMYAPTVPLKRMALPEEIANMAVILVSDMSRTIMGDIVYMTGGSGVFSNEDMDYSFN